MDAIERQRQLRWYGMLLVLLALLGGATLPLLTNPRLGLSAHVGGIMNGMLLLVLASFWPALHWSARTERIALGLFLYSMYGIWVFTLLGAAFGTSMANPIAGAGHSGAPWQEALVAAGLSSGAGAVLAGCVLVLRALRAR